jgi:2-dehydro-3-deoxyphosphogluconate aldolase / (4S)-4-hydroxy-2-oxoglutarate aldolase
MSLDDLRSAGVVAVLRAPSAEHAVKAADTLVLGGITGIEITYSTPDAAAAIREIVRRHGQDAYVGAGTILTTDQAAEAARAGARFLVAPGADAAVARAMRGTGVVTLVGALSPTEVMAARALGADAVKIFPASLGGPAYLRALRGPFPEVPFVPTGGVTAANLSDWLAAGAVAVGAGSELCPSAAMKDGRWETIEQRSREFAAAYRHASSPVAS